MKKFDLTLLAVAVFSLTVSGCVYISKYTPPSNDSIEAVEKPVVQGRIGNQQPKIKVEVELLEVPDFSKFSAPKTPDGPSGNTGNLEGGTMLLRKNFDSK